MKKLTLQTTILCLILGAASLHATQLFWSGNGTVQGGAGTWDTAAAHWGTSTAGPFTTVWNNANSDDATVDNGTGAGGSIAMPATINMNGTLTVNASCGTCPAYSFDGAGTTIFGSASAISVPTGVTRSFNSPYAGIITKIGAGTLAFNNSFGNVTKFIFKQGIASFASFNRFGSGADAADFLTFDGGSVLVNTTTTWTVGKSITLTANGGALNKVSSTITMTLDKAIHGTAGGKLSLQPAGSGGITIISSTAND